MSNNLEAILKKSRDYYYHDGLISSEVDILVEEIDRLTKENETMRSIIKKAPGHIGKAEAERDFFSKRDCNATVQLSYSTNDYPFNKEDLKIVDVGVSDNVYIVESELFNSIQAERDRLREAIKLQKKALDYAISNIQREMGGGKWNYLISLCNKVEEINHKEG